ncbi:hypothetical protein QN277_019327 [Acacia crassicarpa]|nr:hypothetical protein QN277_019327 [Acacia crassicarpa]
MDEYLAKMKTIAYQLVLSRVSISVDELILHTPNSLGAEYNAIVVKLIDQVSLTWIETQASLLAFESCLKQLSQFASLSIQPSVNAVTHGSFVSKKKTFLLARNFLSAHGSWKGSCGFCGRRSKSGRSSYRGGSTISNGGHPYYDYRAMAIILIPAISAKIPITLAALQPLIFHRNLLCESIYCH